MILQSGGCCYCLGGGFILNVDHTFWFLGGKKEVILNSEQKPLEITS